MLVKITKLLYLKREKENEENNIAGMNCSSLNMVKESGKDDKLDSIDKLRSGLIDSKKKMREGMTGDELEEYIREQRVNLLFIDSKKEPEY